MGLVVQAPQSNARRHAVDFDASLLQLDPQNLGTAAPTEGPDQAGPSASAELVFRSPMSGRYYARPAPDKAPFLEVGQEIAKGETLCLLEVMKTFNRLTYAGDGLPKRAKIVAIIPSDGDDLNRGDPILELEVP
jgi:acetyl-CoA carboxylase biotin carboxyl carrier protein